MSVFSSRVRIARDYWGFTQIQLAQKADISRVAYAYYEAGRRRPPLDVALRLADVLDCPIEWLFGTKEERESGYEPESAPVLPWARKKRSRVAPRDHR